MKWHHVHSVAGFWGYRFVSWALSHAIVMQMQMHQGEPNTAIAVYEKLQAATHVKTIAILGTRSLFITSSCVNC